ncbi:MAG TPA: S8 family serine peptidase [Candidatus Poseidoniia archaeon]|nr:S8 family serine peptidase [Candidatus Poseidoniia archaeon]
MTRYPYYLVSVIFVATIFSPLVQTAEEPETIPSENLDLVDMRLQIVFQNPERADELGLAPAPEGKISLVAQVELLTNEHHFFIQELGGEITSSFARFNTICFILPFDKVPEVTYLPGLILLEADVLFYPSLDNSIDSIGTDVIWNEFGFRGEDTTIAILDTGIDFNHESLDDLDDNSNTEDPKISVDSDGMLAFYNANTDKEYPDEQPHDSGSHGTHCAGIAAGTGGPSGTYSGVAPQANLVGVIALDGGSGDEGDLLRAVDWTIENKDRFSIDVMSLSLGGPIVIPGATNNGDSSISQALDVAVEAGIVTVVAIGNGNLGIAAHPASASYPGDSVKAITVGSVNDDHNREIYSSRGPTGDGRLKPDVMAPGGAIMSASAGSGDGYVSYSGTSMATPHVAGVAALMIQANPGISPTSNSDYVKQILRETSDHKVPLDVDCGELYTPNNCYGWGTVELIGAVSRSQDLGSIELVGTSGIQTETNETFVASMEYTMTEYTNRGKDGGTIQNYLTNQNNIPDEIKMVVKYPSSWPKPSKFLVDANEGSGVEGDAGLNAVNEVDGNWVIEANFNYSAQLSSGTIATSFPEFKFDIRAPNFDDTIDVKVEFSLNDMDAEDQTITVSSFTDLPDLFIEELIAPSSISEGQEVSLTARIVNEGPGPAKKFSINFYSDGEIFQTVSSDEKLDSNEAVNIQAKWFASEGDHELKAEIVDISPQDEDNSNHVLQIFIQVGDFLDSQIPMVFITEPYRNEVVSNLVVVKGTASDNNDVEKVEVRILPNDWERANGFENWAWAWNTSQDLNGRYTIEARSFDGYNYSVIYSVEVEVTNDGANRRPTASLKSNFDEVYVNDKVIFSGNTSSDDSQIVKYQFTFGDSKETDWITDSWIEYYYEEPGEYTASLQVEDDEGVKSSSSDTITVMVVEKPVNNVPIAVINLPQTGSTYESNQIIQFSSQGSMDLDGDDLLFTWSSSLDGELYTTPSFFAESFLTDGIHLITLIVSDSNGGFDSVSVQITIRLTREPPANPILPAFNFVYVILTLTFISLTRRKSN